MAAEAMATAEARAAVTEQQAAQCASFAAEQEWARVAALVQQALVAQALMRTGAQRALAAFALRA